MDSMTLGSVADSFAQHWDRALWWFRHHAAGGNFPAASVEMAGCAAINACEKCSEWIFSLRILSVSYVQLIFSCFSSAVLTRPSYLPMSQSHCKVQLRLTLLSRIVWGSQGEPKQQEDTQVSSSVLGLGSFFLSKPWDVSDFGHYSPFISNFCMAVSDWLCES